MPISDSSPERRNLVLASVAIILFYAADGAFIDGSVRIMVVNLSFSKPHVLANFVWVLLFWSALRFWQKSHLRFIADLKSEVRAGSIPQSLAALAAAKAKDQLEGANLADHFEKDVEVVLMEIDPGWGVGVSCNFHKNQGAVFHQEYVHIQGAKGLFYRLRAILRYVVSGNPFAEQLVPYLLFLSVASHRYRRHPVALD